MTFVAAAIGGLAGYGIAGTLTGAAIGAGVGGMIGGGMNQASAAKDASQLQYQGTQAGIAEQRRMFDILNEQGKPYREAGYGALTRINELLPSLTKPITAEDISNMPGYQFAVQQGTGGAMQGMNVGGGGSNVQRAGQKFAIDYTMGTALPQLMQQRRDIYNTLAGVAGIGQNAQTQSNTIGTNTAGNVAQLGVAGANAQAGGIMGGANAMANTVGQLGNAGMMYSLLSKTPVIG
jgi:hypothetical protein